MEKQHIIDGNEAIAKFMGGVKKRRWGHNGEVEYWDFDWYWVPIDSLKYHEDWNRLMPVVKKVNNTHIFSDKIIIYKPALMNALMENDIKEAWNIVTQFIKLCNENPHQHGT